MPPRKPGMRPPRSRPSDLILAPQNGTQFSRGMVSSPLASPRILSPSESTSGSARKSRRKFGRTDLVPVRTDSCQTLTHGRKYLNLAKIPDSASLFHAARSWMQNDPDGKVEATRPQRAALAGFALPAPSNTMACWSSTKTKPTKEELEKRTKEAVTALDALFNQQATDNGTETLPVAPPYMWSLKEAHFIRWKYHRRLAGFKKNRYNKLRYKTSLKFIRDDYIAPKAFVVPQKLPTPPPLPPPPPLFNPHQ
eukprot:m.57197 g.57197  ORF g.57197 m.57197 type:complete len:252 (-) comp22346_c0_seq2:89-844(-)